MKFDIKNDSKLVLFIDMDDTLAYSSDKIQKYLDDCTNFKTEVLNMLEQLCRNCNYLVNEVERECIMAKSEHRVPDLYRFLIFSDYSLNKMSSSDWYTKPIEDSKRYQTMARSFLNQFLEERDTFLEIDNLPNGMKKIFNYRKEMVYISNLLEKIRTNLSSIHKINLFCLNEVKRIILDAKSRNTEGLIIPKFGSLVTMDTNDIIKKNNINKSIDNKKEIIYEIPYKKVENCLNLEDRLYDIVTNGKVYTEPSKEIVNYNNIYISENVNWDAVEFFEDLIHSGMFGKYYILSHYNGEREGRAKKRLTREIIPEANGCICVRFHDREHNVIRRDRSNKTAIAATDYLDISPSKAVLGDDSTANCAHCKEVGGTEILCKPMTESEIINGKLEETGYNRIIDYKNNNAYQYIAEAYEKQLIKRK